MKKFSTAILGLVVVTLLFVVFLALARAEENEVEDFFDSLEGIEKFCPHGSLSEEQRLFDFLSEVDGKIDLVICRHEGFFPESGKEAVEELWDLLVIQQRVKEVLAGPCCARVRALQGVRRLLLGQEEFR